MWSKVSEAQCQGIGKKVTKNNLNKKSPKLKFAVIVSLLLHVLIKFNTTVSVASNLLGYYKWF